MIKPTIPMLRRLLRAQLELARRYLDDVLAGPYGDDTHYYCVSAREMAAHMMRLEHNNDLAGLGELLNSSSFRKSISRYVCDGVADEFWRLKEKDSRRPGSRNVR
jgi:hypothetical protein